MQGRITSNSGMLEVMTSSTSSTSAGGVVVLLRVVISEVRLALQKDQDCHY